MTREGRRRLLPLTANLSGQEQVHVSLLDPESDLEARPSPLRIRGRERAALGVDGILRPVRVEDLEARRHPRRVTGARGFTLPSGPGRRHGPRGLHAVLDSRLGQPPPLGLSPRVRSGQVGMVFLRQGQALLEGQSTDRLLPPRRVSRAQRCRKTKRRRQTKQRGRKQGLSRSFLSILSILSLIMLQFLTLLRSHEILSPPVPKKTHSVPQPSFKA